MATGGRATPADTSKAVSAFMLALDHPFKKEIEIIRRVILGAHPSIAEGIKRRLFDTVLKEWIRFVLNVTCP